MTDSLKLQDILPYSINKMAFKMNLRLKSDLKDLGLGLSEWRILAVLATETSANMKLLAEYSMLEQSTLSKMIDRMCSEELIERSTDKTDGRSRSISLTEKGTEKYKIALALVKAHSKRVVAGMTSNEVDKLTKLVKKMIANLDYPL